MIFFKSNLRIRYGGDSPAPPGWESGEEGEEEESPLPEGTFLFCFYCTSRANNASGTGL